jgi:L-threonylcarbamoyladenylate synthase
LKFTPDINQSIPILEKGGLILFPTDTVWAIGCDATNKEAVERLYALKQKRSPENLVVFLDNEQDIPKYTSQKNIRFFDYIKGIHKPTTVVYEEPQGVAENVPDEDGTVAIRVVKDSFVVSLIKHLGKPVLSATANMVDHSFPYTFNEIEEDVKKGVDYIVQYRQEETIHHEPSSIIKWNTDGSISILRP